MRTAEALHSQALRLTSQGKYSQAAALFRRAIALVRPFSRSNPLFLASLLNDFGVLSKYQGQSKRARKLYHQAAALVPHRRPHSADFRATLCHNLAGLNHSAGRYRVALLYARDGLRVRRLSRPLDPAAIAADEAALAAILVDLERLHEADAILRRILPLYRHKFGPRHHETAFVLANLGALYSKSGDLPAAERTLRQALFALEKSLGRNHPRLGSVLNNLTVVCARREKFKEAGTLSARLRRLLSRQPCATRSSLALVRAKEEKIRDQLVTPSGT